MREFVTREVKPWFCIRTGCSCPTRDLPIGLLTQASELGLRTLALSEAAGGAGADALTAC